MYQIPNFCIALPTIYKHGIPLFRSVYSLLRVLPVWKLYKRLKRRTGGINRNGHLAISLRVRPLQETNQVAILSFGGLSLFSSCPCSPGLSITRPMHGRLD